MPYQSDDLFLVNRGTDSYKTEYQTLKSNITDESANTTVVGSTAPASPEDGDLWFDNVNGILKVYIAASGIWSNSVGSYYTQSEVNSSFLSSNTNDTTTGQLTAQGGFVGDLTGNVTGNLTGNVVGNVTGDVTGNVTGNADSATGVSRTVTAGNGLTGGGTLTSDITLSANANDGISVSSSGISVDSTVIRTTGDQTLDGIKLFPTAIRNSSTGIQPGYGNSTEGWALDSVSGQMFIQSDTSNLSVPLRISNRSVSNLIEFRYNGGLAAGGAVCGFIQVVNSYASIFDAGLASQGGGFTTTSDYRLKENIVDLGSSIEAVKQLKPKTFNYVGQDESVEGFVAHELQEVNSFYATGKKDAVDDEGKPVYQSVDQSKLVPLLTKALQETIAKNEELEARIAVLEGGN